MNTEFAAARLMSRLTAANLAAFILPQHVRGACEAREKSAALAGSAGGEDMSNARSTTAAAMALFLSGIGADNCGFYWPSGASTSGDSTTPAKPLCKTDPPLACVGMCITVTMPGMGTPPPTPSPDCGAGGDLAKLFVTDVQTILACDPNMYPEMASYVVFPPFFSITPQVIETGDGCVQPPALPDTMPLSAFLGITQ